MLSAKKAHELMLLMIKEEIEVDPNLIAIELKIRKACENEENRCMIKENEMTDRAYVTLSEEGYQINRSMYSLNYEIFW